MDEPYLSQWINQGYNLFTSTHQKGYVTYLPVVVGHFIFQSIPSASGWLYSVHIYIWLYVYIHIWTYVIIYIITVYIYMYTVYIYTSISISRFTWVLNTAMVTYGHRSNTAQYARSVREWLARRMSWRHRASLRIPPVSSSNMVKK